MELNALPFMKFTRSFLLLALSGLLFSADPLPAAAPVPTEESGQIGLLVGRLLAQEHYRRQALDNDLSKQFLQLYIDALDYNHRIFLQTDVDEFQRFSSTLDEEILKANVKPGFDIYARYLKRVEQRVAMAKELLKEKYTFDTDESIVIDRHEAPWPATDEDARQLWRQLIKNEILQERLNKKKPTEIVDLLTRRYERLLRAVHEDDADTVLQLYLTALANAFDPHSNYLPKQDLDNFAISMKLSLVGIGALLSSEDGYPKIVEVVPGGPADLDKHLKKNDRICAVGQGSGPMVDVVDMKLSKAVEMIRGEKGSVVRIQYIPAGATDPSVRDEVRLKRDLIKMTEAEAKAKLIERKDDRGRTQRIGYIELPSFYADMMGTESKEPKSTTRDVARLIAKLKTQNIDGLILDLRRNPGGSLPEAISMTGLFVKSGPVVQVKTSRGYVKVLSAEESDVLYDGPLVVLVTHISASASEIVAGALQDYGRAVIVGDESTFGKGTVQKVEELDRFLNSKDGSPPEGGALKITTQKFYRISGGSTQYRGVISDIHLPTQRDYWKLNEASLKNPLPYDEVPPATYTPAARLISLLPELQKRSRDRVRTDPEYDYVREDIVRQKVLLEDKTVSLNENRRQAEKKANRDRSSKRKLERQARKIPAPLTTEITLQSMEGIGTNSAALTKKVLDDAAAALKDSDDDAPEHDASIDPELGEGMNILGDIIKLQPKESPISARNP